MNIKLRGMPKWIGPLVIYSWGLDLKLRGTVLVVTWRCGLGAYLSPDGTPGRATRILLRRGRWLYRKRWRAGHF